VLPNAPIDSATGLPVPTIAVATDGGVSVIKDDGSVVDSAYTVTCSLVYLSKYGVWYAATNGTQSNFATWEDVSSGDGFGDTITSTNVTAFNFPMYTRHYEGVATDYGWAAGGTGSGANSTGPGLQLANLYKSDFSKSMQLLITSSYNTGWMNGDIKLATLSDTDDTNVTGSELVTNGTFDSNTTGWLSAGLTTSVTSGELEVTTTAAGHYMSQQIAVQGGTTYTYSWRARRGTMSQINMSIFCSTTGSNIVSPYNYNATTSMADYNLTFTTPANCTTANVYVIRDSGTTGTAYFDNFSLRLAEEDRSVNGNGLQVFGTVTKSAVATGADLMAYSGLSESNYLKQPYNSDLDFGTGDFSIMCWVKYAHSSGFKNMFLKGAVGHLVVLVKDNNNLFSPYTNNGSGITLTGTNTLPNNVWTHVVYTRSSSGLNQSFINGVLDSSAVLTLVNVNDTSNTGTFIGKDGDLASGDSLALTRVSSTIPSDEQIKKIYEDEKHLFQENAKATLYGTSDAVTALAYDDDTELLHAGTSAGRSVFQGLRRIDNTTDAVGAAISASNGMVAED
jgi:hypothetical protein